ncbi:MAG: hypothetical protein ACK53L_26080, partial [Pirellulaceae bacterium]
MSQAAKESSRPTIGLGPLRESFARQPSPGCLDCGRAQAAVVEEDERIKSQVAANFKICFRTQRGIAYR